MTFLCMKDIGPLKHIAFFLTVQGASLCLEVSKYKLSMQCFIYGLIFNGKLQKTSPSFLVFIIIVCVSLGMCSHM